MNCGTFLIDYGDGACIEQKFTTTTICRTCGLFHPYYNGQQNVYSIGTNCSGEPLQYICHGDCEYDQKSEICHLKTGDNLTLTHFLPSNNFVILKILIILWNIPIDFQIDIYWKKPLIIR